MQPQFAQAETTDRLRQKLTAPVREFSVSEPSIPRVRDVLLGGKDNFAGFLAGLEPVEPGVTEGRAWRAPVPLRTGSRQGHIWAAVGRKPEAAAQAGQP